MVQLEMFNLNVVGDMSNMSGSKQTNSVGTKTCSNHVALNPGRFAQGR